MREKLSWRGNGVNFSISSYPKSDLQIVTKLPEWILTNLTGFSHAILKLMSFPRRESLTFIYFFKTTVWYPSRTSYHSVSDQSRNSMCQVGCISPNLSKSLYSIKFGEIWRDLIPETKISLFRQIRLTTSFFARHSRDSWSLERVSPLSFE